MTLTKKIACLGLILCLFHLSTQAQDNILLQNATIIEGTSQKAPYKGSVWIENGKIKKVFRKTAKTPNGTTVIDCTGKYITPGLIESHVHLATIDLSDMASARSKTDKILENMVRHGITTLRDMAGDAPFLARYQQESETGAKIAPAIFYAAQFAGPSYFKMFESGSRKKMGIHPWERAITDTTDIKKAVREAKDAGVTGIKTYAQLSLHQMEEITKEARKIGLQVWSHATIYPIKPSDAANQSVNSLSHAADILFEQLPKDSVDLSYAWKKVYEGMKPDRDALSPLFHQMKKKGIFFDPTVFHATNNKLYYAVDILKWAHQAGVKIVAGTDWIYPETNEMVPLYDEAKIYVEKAGFSPLQTIETLTYNGASVIGLKDRGRIQKGKRADILILDTDPLQDIQALFTPQTVIKQGKVVFKK